MLKTKGFIAVTSLIVLASALGGTAGWFLGNMYKDIGPVTNNVYLDKPVEFSNNIDAVKKFMGAANISDMNDVSNVDVVSLVGKNGLTIGDIAETAQLYVYSKENITVKSNNLANSKVYGIQNNQATNSTWIKRKDIYFKENVSYSNNASFGERTYNSKNDKITPLTKPFENEVNYFRVNTNPKPTDVDFSKAGLESYYVNVPEGETNEDGSPKKSYSTMFGTTLFKPFNYDFTEANIKKDDSGKYIEENIKNSKTGEETTYKTEIKNIDDGYEITLTIDEKAMENYASYIFTTTRDASSLAKMKEKPKFVSTGVKIITDKKLQITSLHTDEFYNVISNVAGAVPTVCSSDLVISYDSEEAIPSVKEKISYE